MSLDGSFFGGFNILDGMPLRRAGAILFAIESRTAQLVAQSQQALNTYLPERTLANQEKAFFAAIASGRDLPIQPAIQDLERYAPEWRTLVPADDAQRAALANSLAQKYRFRRQDVPALSQALGLETEGVGQAYERLFQKSLASIYAADVPAREQARWLSSRVANRLERLPPFWTAFSLTLTETVGGSILALPIALAGVGPLAGVVFLVVLGLVNVLTVMGIVEAITRNGNMRYGSAYFGRLVGDLLGRPASAVLVPALFGLNVIGLVAYYVGIATTLADVSGISPLFWCVLVLLVTIYYLRGKGLNATVASALVIGMINILIILVLCILSMPYIELDNLLYVNLPLVNGQAFDPTIFELVFGVALAAFFGHTSAANAAKVVLRRDPGGGALIWGNLAAMLTAIGLYSLWVLAVNGSIPAAELAGVTGTALAPLSEKLGGVVPALGIVYAVLAMGIGVIYMSYGVYYQVLEMLPGEGEAGLWGRKHTRFLVSIAPILLLFLLVEWMLATGQESFAWLISALGGLLIPLLGGIFPVLMLAASRRKGEYVPQRVFAFLGNPLVLAAVYLIYLGGVFVYGVLIWETPVERLGAIGMGLLVLAVTFLVTRQGAFTPRLVVELRVEVFDRFERASLSLVDGGRRLSGAFHLVTPQARQSLRGSQVEIPEYQQLSQIEIEFLAHTSREMKLWVHRVTPEGSSEPIPAAVKTLTGDSPAADQVHLPSGQMVGPINAGTQGIEISLG